MKKIGIPGLIWYTCFIFVPIILVVFVSFLGKGTYGGINFKITLDSYYKVLNTRYLEIFFSSVKLSTLTSIVCLCLAICVAWFLSVLNERYRLLALCLFVLPSLTSLIVRIYGLKLFFSLEGPFANFLNFVGIEFDPFVLSANAYLVFFGMVTTYFPFALLPIFSAFEKFDFSLVEAALDLSANQFQILFHVILPQIKGALLGSVLLVFVPCLGEFVIPDLLGGAKNMLLGNLITDLFLKYRDWPSGAAMTVVAVFLLFVLWKISFIINKKLNNQSRYF